MTLPAELTAEQRHDVLDSIYERGDALMKRFVVAHFVIALALAPVYKTWLATLGVGSGAAVLFFAAVTLAPRTFLTRVICGISLQTFVALHIHQMHGMAEMHFFFFTAFTMMIVYCDWASMWPGALLIIGQHLLFRDLDATRLLFHVGIATGHVALCGWWAHHLRERALHDAAQHQQVAGSRERVAEQLAITRISEAVLQRTTADLHEKSEILRSVLGAIPEGAIVADQQYRFLVYNPAAERIFGPPPPSPEVATQHNLPLARTLAGESIDDEEISVQSGERITSVLVSGRPLRGSSGEVWGSIIVCRDITEHKQNEMRMRHAQKMEAMGRLAGGVAHDFNNLLTVITGYSNLLLADDTATPDQLDSAGEIAQAADRAAAVTRQLLTFSRRQVVQPRPVQTSALLDNLREMLLSLAGDDVHLTINLHSGIGVVKVDPGQFEQVLVNLVINAREAMPSGGALMIEALNVSVKPGEPAACPEVPPGDWVAFTVSDSGCGMSPEVQKHIFEPFFTTKEKGKGTGLGLATVYGIVQQNGGHIGIHSEPGHGSSFMIYLPRVEAASEAPAANSVGATIHGGGETILLVEDEGAVRTLARRILSENGYRVIEAAGGTEAIHRCRDAGTIDLVLTDVVMPGMNGPELIGRLRPLLPNAKVLYMSGYTDSALDYFRQQGGGAAFLAKPFSPETLLRKIREVLAASTAASA